MIASPLSRRAGALPVWWRRSVEGPSAWPRRITVAVLAFAGLVVSIELAFFQYGLVPTVWDPWFGDGSVKVLESAFSRALPVHDAALGAVAYLAELVLELTGGTTRWRRRPWQVLLLGLLATAMALVAIGLVALQVFVVGALCTLCLVSAAVSLTVPWFVLDEALAAWRQVRRGRRYGLSWLRAVRGEAPGAD
ncbi:vitamin K epoxide reductase family protein [Dactylosporangium salmoneum]|uniref:Vitamin K epoxide reductase domain-containing protein n=1 Tax=Dactylosporangium salmoneum TaxID=53361 RepID=A0ABP5T6X7_9ACTN